MTGGERQKDTKYSDNYLVLFLILSGSGKKSSIMGYSQHMKSYKE